MLGKVKCVKEDLGVSVVCEVSGNLFNKFSNQWEGQNAEPETLIRGLKHVVQSKFPLRFSSGAVQIPVVQSKFPLRFS